jgi:putative protease
LHLSVQAAASSPEAINFYCREFGIRRAVLPRILTVPEIRKLKTEISCEIETFVFGNHGLMVEGRCSLTNYAVGVSTNMDGACSPASEVRYDRSANGDVTARLGLHVIDRFAPDEQAGYPTICKGRYCTAAREEPYYAFEEPISLNLMEMLPALVEAGVDALKIEGRQRSRAYVANVVGSFRKAIDSVAAGRTPDLANLIPLTEGQKQTQGAFITKKWR